MFDGKHNGWVGDRIREYNMRNATGDVNLWPFPMKAYDVLILVGLFTLTIPFSFDTSLPCSTLLSPVCFHLSSLSKSSSLPQLLITPSLTPTLYLVLRIRSLPRDLDVRKRRVKFCRLPSQVSTTGNDLMNPPSSLLGLKMHLPSTM